jgi:aminoglycoside phosphotransferase (APT) family kinase protein
MSSREPDKKFAQVVQKIDAQNKLLRAWQLQGGVSAQVTALEIERPDGQTQKMIIRQHGAIDLKHNPQIAADEFKLLHFLRSEGLPTPTPYYLDQSGDIFSTSYSVIEYIEGKPEFAPSNLLNLIFQFATHLSRIHQVDCSKLDVSFLPAQEQICAGILRNRSTNADELVDEAGVRETLQAVWPIPQRNPSVLLHGDFWPGNILWQDAQLVAIIDWEDARRGDPLADVANSRLEILWAFGIDAMHRFTHHYQSMTTIDFTNLPYCDLFAALRSASQFTQWAADDIAAKTMRERHQWFIAQASDKLPLSL